MVNSSQTIAVFIICSFVLGPLPRMVRPSCAVVEKIDRLHAEVKKQRFAPVYEESTKRAQPFNLVCHLV
jgi:hypothetical protein